MAGAVVRLSGKDHPRSGYTEEIAEKICGLLEAGWSLNRICKEEGMPGAATVRNWVRKIPEFAEAYTLARKNQLEYWADEIVDLSDDDSQDIVGGKPNSAAVNRHRLMVDTRKFILAHLMPEKYGQLVKQEISGPDGGPIQTEPVDKENLARWLAFQLSQKKDGDN